MIECTEEKARELAKKTIDALIKEKHGSEGLKAYYGVDFTDEQRKEQLQGVLKQFKYEKAVKK